MLYIHTYIHVYTYIYTQLKCRELLNTGADMHFHCVRAM